MQKESITMTYNTPELLSVGAAQNFVLGATGNDIKVPSVGLTNFDDGDFLYSPDAVPPDSNSW
jgi:hypothetical protein